MDRNISPYLEKTEWAARKRKGLSGKLLDLRRLASVMPHDSVPAEEATIERWDNGGKTSERNED